MKTKFGIVGCGFLGNIVANAWKNGLLEDYELVGVTSRSTESAQKAAEAVGCTVCADVDEMCIRDRNSCSQLVSSTDFSSTSKSLHLHISVPSPEVTAPFLSLIHIYERSECRRPGSRTETEVHEPPFLSLIHI